MTLSTDKHDGAGSSTTPASLNHGLRGSGLKARRASEFEAVNTDTLSHRIPSPMPDKSGMASLDESAFEDSPEYPSMPTTPHGHPQPRTAYFEKTGGQDIRHAERPSGETPLPYMKMMPLIVARLSEGLIFSVIFPYINQMVHDFGVPEEKVGVWSSMAESALMCCEAITAPIYAPLADRLGRRPVFLGCLFFWGIFAVCFGFVQSVGMAIVMRGCLGLLAGCGVLSRTMIGEMCDKSNRVKGFAVFSPSLTVGVTLGPLVGGFLAKPVPRILPPSFELFHRLPYLLPAIVSGATGVAAFVCSYIYTPETLPPSMRKSAGRNGSDKGAKRASNSLLMYKPFQRMLVLYGLNNSVMFCWEALFPLFAFTSKDLGGLELDTQTIGVVLAVAAVLSIMMTIFIFPVMHRAIPEALCLKICLLAYPAAVIFFPIMWYCHSTEGASLGAMTILVLSVQMILRRVGDFASTLLDTVVFEIVPGPEHVAMANSLTFCAASVGRAVGPFIISWFFSLSTTFQSPYSPGRYLVWIVFALFSIPSVYLAAKLRDPPGQPATRTGDEEEHVELLRRKSAAGAADDHDDDDSSDPTHLDHGFSPNDHYGEEIAAGRDPGRSVIV